MKLDKIAQLMMLNAKATGKARHVLGRRRGMKKALIVNLRFTKNVWKLSLTRWAVQASQTERSLCKNAFRIPGETTFEANYKDGWGIIRYTWAGQTKEQLPLFDPNELETITPLSQYYD